MLDDQTKKAIKLCFPYDRVYASLFQDRLSIGFKDATKLMIELENLGVVSKVDSYLKPRDVLIKSFDELKS